MKKAVWTVSSIIYLIIATVFILNSQFSQEAFAQADTSDLSRGENADGSDHGGVEPGAPPSALSSNDHGNWFDSSALSSNDHGDDVDVNDTSGLLEPSSIASDLSSNERSNESRVSPPDFLTSNLIDGGRFWHNSQDIAMELSSLTPAEIRTYPLNDLSNNDIALVLGFLSPSNLTKVLLNIPAGDLAEIFNNLPQDKGQEVLNRLPQDKSQEVLDRLTGELFK